MKPKEHNQLNTFNEVQRFRNTWVLIVVLAAAGLQWVAAVQQLLLGMPFGQNLMPNSTAFIFWILFGIGLPIFFFYSRLVTEVRTDGVYFQFIPFHRSFRRIAFADLVYCQLITYHAIREYRGWGIRRSRKGTAYIVNGNKGVQFTLKNGKRILIGSQRADIFWQSIPQEIKVQARNGD